MLEDEDAEFCSEERLKAIRGRTIYSATHAAAMANRSIDFESDAISLRARR